MKDIYSLTDVIQHTHSQGDYLYVGEKESLSKAAKLFQKNVKFLLIINSNKEIIGVIAKAHRRY